MVSSGPSTAAGKEVLDPSREGSVGHAMTPSNVPARGLNSHVGTAPSHSMAPLQWQEGKRCTWSPGPAVPGHCL